MSSAVAAVRRREHFEHMADMGVRGIGPSREAAFEEAAFATCATVLDPALVRPETLVEVDCSAKEDDFLLVDWLNALIADLVLPVIAAPFSMWNSSMAENMQAPQEALPGTTRAISTSWLF